MTRNTFLISTLVVCGLTLSGCATQHHEDMETEIRVLKAQLAQQEDALIQQSQALEHLRTLHEERSDEDQQLTSELQGLVTSLSQLRREEQENEDDQSECAVVEPVSPANGKNCTDRAIIGELEYIHIKPPEKYKEARIDTGATTSSLDAQDIETFERDGEDYVRFILPDREAMKEREEDDDEDSDNGEAPGQELELPVERFARITQSSTDDDERRPVVELQYQLGSEDRVGEFTLTDRSHLTYGVLVGRNILRDHFVVDVGQKHTTSLSQAIEDGDYPDDYDEDEPAEDDEDIDDEDEEDDEEDEDEDENDDNNNNNGENDD